MGSRARRHHNLHHSDRGVQKRALKYVQKELKRMKLHGGGQNALHGFRVHPEFGWCHKALQQLGYEVVTGVSVSWYKQRPLRVISRKTQENRTWVHIRNRGLQAI